MPGIWPIRSGNTGNRPSRAEARAVTVLPVMPRNDRLASGLRMICAALNLDPSGAQLLRNVNNAVFRLAKHPLVVRLVTFPSYVPRAELAVAAARVFAEHRVPAIRLLPGVPQPVRAGDFVATVWQAVNPTGPRPGGADLARLMRAVHAVPPCGGLPEWDPLTDFDNRVWDTAMSRADRAFLLARSAELAAATAELRFALPTSVLHGDAHLGNVIPGPDGPVLCDFDSCSVGPPEWDLTPVAVADVRFRRPAAHQRDFIEAYGFDVREWEGFEVMHGIRDLKLIAGVFPRVGSSPAVQAEFDRRMASLRSGRRFERWWAVRR